MCFLVETMQKLAKTGKDMDRIEKKQGELNDIRKDFGKKIKELKEKIAQARDMANR